MFSDFSVFYLLVYAAGIGFAAAIIYTNIQRTALSKFINHMVEFKCFNDSSAVSLNDIKLSGVQKTIIKSAVNKQHGLKRIVCCVENVANITDDEVFFEKKDNCKYYLSSNDVVEITKKYSFTPMPTWQVTLFITALAAVVIITSFLVNLLIETVSTPKLDDSGSETEIQEEINKPQNEQNVDESDDIVFNEGKDNVDGPRIPV